MILAVSYSLTGMHAGRHVIHRVVKGDQLWTVKLDVVDGLGERHEHEAIVDTKIPLVAISPKATELMDEYLAEFGNIVRRAKWEAYYRPNPSQRKKPKRRRA